MNKGPVGISVVAIVGVALLIVLAFGDKGEESELVRGASSTVGELTKEEIIELVESGEIELDAELEEALENLIKEENGNDTELAIEDVVAEPNFVLLSRGESVQYTDEGLGFTFKYPSGWRITESLSDEGTGSLHFYNYTVPKKPSHFFLGGSAKVSFTILDSIVDSNDTPVDPVPFTIGGVEGTQYVDPGFGQEILVTRVAYPDDSKKFLSIAMYGSFNDAGVKQMLESFTWALPGFVLEEDVSDVVLEESVKETEEVVVEESEPTVVVDGPAVQNLVGLYMFDEGVGSILRDSVLGNTASAINIDESAWVNGSKGQALRLDAINDYVSIPHSDGLDFGATDQSYTISLWLWSSFKPGGERQIIGKGGRAGASPFMIRLNNNGYPSFRISDGFEANTVFTTNSIVRSSWMHVVAVRDADAGRIKLYLNGTERGASVTDTTKISLQNTLPIEINKHDAGGTYFYHNMNIDEVRFYDKALSNAEVQELFALGQN